MTSKQRVVRNHNARNTINNAIKNGHLERAVKCGACGKARKTEAHHTRNDKASAVKWYCRSCHIEVDNKLRAKKRKKK